MNLNQSMIGRILICALGLCYTVPSSAVEATDQTLPYRDTDFACIDAAKAQKYSLDFSIDVASFGGLELCDSKVDSKKLFNDLQIIQDGKFTAAGSNHLIRGFVDANNYYSWMKQQTRSISRGNDVPFATAYNSGGHFTMQNGWAELSTLGRVGTVLHEARHTAGYVHYICTQGTYQDSSVSGCDQSYEQAGSHAVEMEYYARVSTLGTNFHPVYKSMARLMAMARANFMFNTPVLKTREGILAIDADHKAQLYDPKSVDGKWKQRELPSFLGELKRTSAGASIFEGQKAFSIELYGNSGFNPDIKDDYSYFKLLTRGQTFQEFEEFDLGTKRYATGIQNNNQIRLFVFPEGQWGEPLVTPINVFRTATALENGEEGFFIVSDQGEIRSFNPEQDSFSAAKNFKWSPDLMTATKLDGKILSLRTDGQIYESQRTGSGSSWVPWGPAQNQKFLQMTKVPLYDAFEVN